MRLSNHWRQLHEFDVKRDRLVLGGYDVNGNALYVCRSELSENIKLPGKLKPEDTSCNTPYDGYEERQSQFEILVNRREDDLMWQPFKGTIPWNAVVGGYEHLEPLYIGKCILSGVFGYNKPYKTEIVGKIHLKPSDPVFVYVGFGGYEYKCRDNVSILVCNGMEPKKESNEKKQMRNKRLNSLAGSRNGNNTNRIAFTTTEINE